MSVIATSKKLLLPTQFPASVWAYDLRHLDTTMAILPIDNISFAYASKESNESTASMQLRYADGQRRMIHYRADTMEQAMAQHATLLNLITEKTGQSLIQITKAGREGVQYLNPEHVEGFWRHENPFNYMITAYAKGAGGVRVANEFKDRLLEEVTPRIPSPEIYTYNFDGKPVAVSIKPQSLHAVWREAAMGTNILIKDVGCPVSIPDNKEDAPDFVNQITKSHPGMVGFSAKGEHSYTAFYTYPEALADIGLRDENRLYVIFAGGAKSGEEKEKMFEYVGLFNDDATAKARGLILELSQR